jgi:hypothetical protein
MLIQILERFSKAFKADYLNLIALILVSVA